MNIFTVSAGRASELLTPQRSTYVGVLTTRIGGIPKICQFEKRHEIYYDSQTSVWYRINTSQISKDECSFIVRSVLTVYKSVGILFLTTKIL